MDNAEVLCLLENNTIIILKEKAKLIATGKQ